MLRNGGTIDDYCFIIVLCSSLFCINSVRFRFSCTFFNPCYLQHLYQNSDFRVYLVLPVPSITPAPLGNVKFSNNNEKSFNSDFIVTQLDLFNAQASKLA